jgi:hypothetical protein
MSVIPETEIPPATQPLPEKLREMTRLHSSRIRESFFVLFGIVDIIEMDGVGTGTIRRSEYLLTSIRDLDTMVADIEKRLGEAEVQSSLSPRRPSPALPDESIG